VRKATRGRPTARHSGIPYALPSPNFFDLILVRALRPDGFVFVQHEPQAGGRNVHRLPERGAQMHFDASLHAVPACFVLEAAQIKIRAQLPVDARQQIQVERRGYARWIVVSEDL